MSNETRNYGLKLCVMMILPLVCSPAFGGNIDLEVVGNPPNVKLEITASDVKCGSDKNCIKTNKGNQQKLEFKLDKSCNDDENQYKLTGMQFSMVQRVPDGAGGMKKAFGTYSLPGIVSSDFQLDAAGNVIWDGVNNSLSDKKIKLKNKNDGEYVVFFQIEATHCTDVTDVIDLDPRIENTGK